MAALDSLVSELHIVGGVRQSTTPATSVFTAPRRAARGRVDDTLYVLADLGGDSAARTLGELMQRIADTYWSSAGSVTSALRAALTSGGEWLLDRNTNAPVNERETGGAACVVLRGNSVYIAQAGAACVFVGQHGRVEQYPARDAEPSTPLGMARAVDVRFGFVEMSPGDVVLMTDARVGAQWPIEAISSAILGVGVERALDNLAQLAGQGDVIALVIEAAMAEAAAPKVAAPAPEPPPTRSAAAPITTAPARAAAPRPSVVAPVEDNDDEDEDDEPLAASPREPKAAAAGAWVSALADGVRRGASSVGVAGQAMVQRTLPDHAVPPGTARRKAESRWSAPVMAGIALAIPILVSLIAVTIYVQGAARAETAALLTTARNEATLAGQTTGREARERWQVAASSAAQVLQRDPNSADAAQIVVQSQVEIDRIDNVIRLKPVPLWDSQSIGSQRLALQGFALFVLNRGTNTIDQLQLNATGDALEAGSTPERVYDPALTIDGRTAGTLLDMTWMNSSDKRQTASLIVLHQSGLFEYSRSFGLRMLDFGSNAIPVGGQRLRSYAGNLYMLDAAASQVLRYEPKDDGYATAPTNYFKTVQTDTAKAVDMVIDGNVYLVLNGGQIRKYLGGEPDKFQLRGLPTPVDQPAVLSMDLNRGDSSLYLAEQASGRIVQLRPDGQFVRQFRADGDAFSAVSDMLVDEQNRRLYVISRGVLYTAALPPVQ